MLHYKGKMEEIIIKLEVPKGTEHALKVAIERALREFLEEFEFSLAKEILKESEFSESQARELGKEVNVIVSKNHS